MQAEPWGQKPAPYLAIEEQAKLMNVDDLKNNIAYARKTGLSEFYLWGAEWWYWQKERHNNPSFWLETKKLFQ